jgi:hypothetical protein
LKVFVFVYLHFLSKQVEFLGLFLMHKEECLLLSFSFSIFFFSV